MTFRSPYSCCACGKSFQKHLEVTELGIWILPVVQYFSSIIDHSVNCMASALGRFLLSCLSKSTSNWYLSLHFYWFVIQLNFLMLVPLAVGVSWVSFGWWMLMKYKLYFFNKCASELSLLYEGILHSLRENL